MLYTGLHTPCVPVFLQESCTALYCKDVYEAAGRDAYVLVKQHCVGGGMHGVYAALVVVCACAQDGAQQQLVLAEHWWNLLNRAYLDQLNLYRQRIWTCKATGTPNLTYEQALASETRAQALTSRV